MSEEDLIYLQNILEADKMELFLMLPFIPTGRPLYSLLMLLIGVMSLPWVILPMIGILRRENVMFWRKNTLSFRRICFLSRKRYDM